MSGRRGVPVGGLLEREAELARVDRVFDQLGGGVGAVIVVEGPAGIGKSELLAAVDSEALARGFGVLRARGSEFEAEIGFGLGRQVLEPVVRAASPGERRRLLAGVARVGARALGAERGEPPADQFAAMHGLYWLLANRADHGPLVVLVDDVQWADDPSLAWLGYLPRRVRDLSVVLVLGLRSGDPGGERDELAQMVGDGNVARIALGPLSAGAVGAIVRARLDGHAEEPFCLACSELTGGNPLFVHELLAAAREERLAPSGAGVPALQRIAPAAVGTSVLGRLRRLGAEAVGLARSVAVLGAGVEVALAARLAELDPIAAELTADRLAAAQILAPFRPLEFAHPMIEAAVREDIAPGALRLAHRRAAALLGEEGERSLARVAAHLLACGPSGDEWVVERLLAAAREALDRRAPGIAAAYAHRALIEPPTESERAAVLLVLGMAEWRAGESDGIAHLEEALSMARDDLGTVTGACAVLALAYHMTDQAERAVDMLDRARATLGNGDAAVALTAEAASALVGLVNERTASTALRRAEALRGRVGALSDPPVHLLVTLAFHAARMNRSTEARDLAARALTCDPFPPPLDICPSLIAALTVVECYGELDRLCQDLLSAARGRGALQETVAILLSRAWSFCDRGMLADAEGDTRWALKHARGVRRMHAVTELIRTLVERDEISAADQALGLCADPGSTSSGEVLRFLLARGELRVAQGRLHEALDDFLECGQRCVRLGIPMLSAAPWRAEAALVHAALGETDQARRLASEQVDLARAFGLPRTLGISLRASGLVEGGETGLELLAEAVQTLEGSQSPLEHARVLSDYGAALRRAGSRIQARAELERALDLAHYCGATRVANQARAELIVAGAKPRRDAITGRDALTAAELRVARLAADGLTNREIAQSLFITTRTAKVHLNRVYRKLDIARRGQLADALTGLVDDSEHRSARATAIS